MATATLELKGRLETQPAAALPIWWRQRHTYVLGGLAAIQVVGCRWSMRLIDESTWLGEFALGGLFAQCFLLGLWGALGGLTALARWGIVAAIFLAGVISTSLGPLAVGETVWLQALSLGFLGAMLVLAFAACLLPLRGLAGWRVDFDPAVYRDVRGPRGQVGFLDIAGYSIGVAASLTAFRLAVQADVLDADWDTLLIIGTTCGLVLLTGAGIAGVLLTCRWLGLALAASAVWPVVVAAGQSALATYVPAVEVFGDSPTVLGIRLHLLGFYGGVALLVAVTLTALRLFGLKLIAVPLPDRIVGDSPERRDASRSYVVRVD